MSCQRCGRRAKGRLCRDCERDERWQERFEEEAGHVVDDESDIPDEGSDDDPELVADGGDHPPVCDYCGGFIEDPDQECPALDDGRCHP